MKRAKDTSWSRGALIAVRMLDAFADTRHLTTVYKNHGATVRVFKREVRAGNTRTTVQVLVARLPVKVSESGQIPPS